MRQREGFGIELVRASEGAIQAWAQVANVGGIDISLVRNRTRSPTWNCVDTARVEIRLPFPLCIAFSSCTVASICCIRCARCARDSESRSLRRYGRGEAGSAEAEDVRRGQVRVRVKSRL